VGREEPTSADDISTAFVPAFRDGVTIITVEDESILYEEATGAIHHLNHTATLVCGLIDNVSTIDQIIAQLEESFASNSEEIAMDVLDLVRELALRGLIAEVGPERSSAGTGDS
jgi:hypothetical protein